MRLITQISFEHLSYQSVGSPQPTSHLANLIHSNDETYNRPTMQCNSSLFSLEAPPSRTLCRNSANFLFRIQFSTHQIPNPTPGKVPPFLPEKHCIGRYRHLPQPERAKITIVGMKVMGGFGGKCSERFQESVIPNVFLQFWERKHIKLYLFIVEDKHWVMLVKYTNEYIMKQ